MSSCSFLFSLNTKRISRLIGPSGPTDARALPRDQRRLRGHGRFGVQHEVLRRGLGAASWRHGRRCLPRDRWGDGLPRRALCRAFTATGGEEVLLVGKPCNAVPGSRIKTSAKVLVQAALATVPARQVRRRCEHCPHEAGAVLVLYLQDPAL